MSHPQDHGAGGGLDKLTSAAPGDGEALRDEVVRGQGNSPFPILGSVVVLVAVVAAIAILVALLVWLFA